MKARTQNKELGDATLISGLIVDSCFSLRQQGHHCLLGEDGHLQSIMAVGVGVALVLFSCNDKAHVLFLKVNFYLSPSFSFIKSKRK